MWAWCGSVKGVGFQAAYVVSKLGGIVRHGLNKFSGCLIIKIKAACYLIINLTTEFAHPYSVVALPSPLLRFVALAVLVAPVSQALLRLLSFFAQRENFL